MKIINGLLFLVLVTSAQLAHACTCVSPDDPSISFDRMKKVFVGKVTGTAHHKITPSSPHALDITFEVLKSYKGAPEKTVIITSEGNTDGYRNGCAFAFQKDQEYLVYAHAESDLLTAYKCGKTKTLSEAKEDIVELDKAHP